MNTSSDTSEYMLFFRGPDWDANLTFEQTEKVMNDALAWMDKIQQQGKVKGGQVLARTGKTISAGKERVVSDGPFAETKESVGGYLVILAKDLDEAVALAQGFPTLDYGISIDIRPVLDECPISKRLRERRELAVA